ncbi:STAS domain-containing protein [Actinoplanes sp. NPDC023714]|uniref:STAS domain-containing protein n=1 Tax=Actinoplanes sp. NPDC023714 TaxID=3154322 RepID=UPI0033F1EFBA
MQAVSLGEEADGTLVLTLCGELDFTNAGTVAAVIREAVAGHRPPAVRIDVAGVGFLDSSGVGVLVQGLQSAEEVAARFAVVNPGDKVYDQLRISGLLELFNVSGAPG